MALQLPEGLCSTVYCRCPRRDFRMTRSHPIPEGILCSRTNWSFPKERPVSRQSTKPEGLTFQRSQTSSEESVTPSSSTAPRGCFRRLCCPRPAAVRRRLCFAAMRLVSTSEEAPANQARPSIGLHHSSDFAMPPPKVWRQAPKDLPLQPQPKLKLPDPPAS
jgi:hypothetical protein